MNNNFTAHESDPSSVRLSMEKEKKITTERRIANEYVENLFSNISRNF